MGIPNWKAFANFICAHNFSKAWTRVLMTPESRIVSLLQYKQLVGVKKLNSLCYENLYSYCSFQKYRLYILWFFQGVNSSFNKAWIKNSLFFLYKQLMGVKKLNILRKFVFYFFRNTVCISLDSLFWVNYFQFDTLKFLY